TAPSRQTDTYSERPTFAFQGAVAEILIRRQEISTMARGRHAAGRSMGTMRKAAAVVLTAGALVSTGSSNASADVLDGPLLAGQKNTDQDGEQNLDCGNSSRLIRYNIADTVRRDKVCIDTDGHTRRHSHHFGGAQAEGAHHSGPRSTPPSMASRT
ncbi:hypothetical protein ACFW1M_38545, partial [Streptomyces inhibens]